MAFNFGYPMGENGLKMDIQSVNGYPKMVTFIKWISNFGHFWSVLKHVKTTQKMTFAHFCPLFLAICPLLKTKVATRKR